MKFTAYIESNNNFPIADWAVDAYVGFKQKQIDVILFEAIEEVPKHRFNVVVAHIETTDKYLQRFGLQPQRAINIPVELRSYADRQIEYMTIAEFKQDTRLPIFIKPNGIAKQFEAGVITKESSRQGFFNELPDDCPVMISEPIDIVSEYRCYVYNKKLVGIYWYKGNFRLFPDVKVIDAAIADYVTQPMGYGIDFGITGTGKTILIEVNDGYALGNYGLEAPTYVNLLLARWLELMKDAK